MTTYHKYTSNIIAKYLGPNITPQTRAGDPSGPLISCPGHRVDSVSGYNKAAEAPGCRVLGFRVFDFGVRAIAFFRGESEGRKHPGLQTGSTLLGLQSKVQGFGQTIIAGSNEVIVNSSYFWVTKLGLN